MAETSPPLPRPPDPRGSPGQTPLARLELRHATARPLLYEVFDAGFLIGSVAGCDLRLPGADLPPLLCLIAPRGQGVGIRKLVPAYPVTVNGQPLSNALLGDGDRVSLGSVELLVRLPNPTPLAGEETAALAGLREELAARQRRLEEQTEELETDRVLWYRRREEMQREARQLDERVRAFQAEAERREAEWAKAAAEADVQRRLLEEQQREWQRRHAEHRAECDRGARALEEARADLQAQQAQHQEDLVRLHRHAAALDDRHRQLQDRTREVEGRFEELHQETKELEGQARQVTAARAELQEQTERLVRDRADLDLRRAELDRRTADLEHQQVALAGLRARWERLSDRVRREEQEIVDRRARLEEDEAVLRAGAQELRRLREEFAAASQAAAGETLRVEECRAATEAALAHLADWQAKWAVREEQQRARAAELDRQAARLAEEAAELRLRSAQVSELQDRLGAERQTLREREAVLDQAESGREALQEQLRRRSEDLAERQRALADQERLQAEADAALAARRAEWERERQLVEEQWGALRQDLDGRAATVGQAEEVMRRQEENLSRHRDRLKKAGRAVAAARKALAEQRTAHGAERDETEAALAGMRAEWEALRHEAAGLEAQLPGWEAHARTAAEQLQRARDQLRGHLGELHAYARQAQEDLEGLRSQVRAEAEQVREQGLALHRARDEHRLAVAAFRQQLIDWQGQVAELKGTLSRDQSRLERRHAEVEATSVRLAERAEKLEAQELAVTERRGEMERHLADMREWYRRKLRELTERFYGETPGITTAGGRPVEGAAADGEVPAAGILALTGEVNPGDRQLGDLLRSLELVDADTLARLLVEARKQRQSLRQVLLASGYVTLYQMALIEAGNLDGLMLGPVRVMDRLRVTARETVYRVFDPRHDPDRPGGEGYALLRHLAEAEMDDAVHPDEFRQRFAAAARVRHPNHVATLEVLDIHARPAALQEWVRGLAAPDWPALYAVPGVWVRLMCQMARGLFAGHQTGLVHGHLHPGLLILNTDGVLKVGGWGEPSWLADPEALTVDRSDAELGPRDDLAALGRIARGWATTPVGRRKGAKLKPLAEPLQLILDRLDPGDGDESYPDVAAVLEDLERAVGEVPANPEAWDRLLRHVRADSSLRQSA